MHTKVNRLQYLTLILFLSPTPKTYSFILSKELMKYELKFLDNCHYTRSNIWNSDEHIF